MKNNKLNLNKVIKIPFSLERRSFVQKILGVSVATASAYFLSSTTNIAEAAFNTTRSVTTTEVKPGEHDQYYGFWSGGPSGEVRILGIPSMRELKRIPVFNYDCAYGYGLTNFTKRFLTKIRGGDTHHVHLSYTDGTYDGKYAFVNDKAIGRLARIRLDYMEVDCVVKIPYSQGTHGIFPSRHKLDAVYCNAEFRSPLINIGLFSELPKKYVALHTCIDAKTMQPRWQIAVNGNLDLCATDYNGKYSMATCYNSEEGVTLDEMIAADRDWLAVFNLRRIESALKEGKGNFLFLNEAKNVEYAEMGKINTKTPMFDGRGKNPYVLYIPIPKNPHGVNVDPTGKYVICSGKLSSTVSIIPFTAIDDAFEGKIKNPRDCVVAEPEVGIGPLHTAFDADGNAYTSIFIDSVICKWNIAKAVEGKNPIIQKLDVQYQVGHVNGTMSETKEVETKWIISLNKFSKDRFLPVGPFFPENDQLINITSGKMILVHDGPAAPEPHDAVIVPKRIIETKQVWEQDDRKFTMERRVAQTFNTTLGSNKFIRKNKKVFVFLSSVAPNFGLSQICVNLGDWVTIIQTNFDKIADTCHGFCLCEHGINYGIAPMETVSVSFLAFKPGMYWYYCPWFCHALHLEMRGRFIVSPYEFKEED